MKIFHYDSITKEYTGSSDARLDPLEMELNKTERWLLPANATFDAPPECPEGKMITMADEWEIVDIPIPPEPEPADPIPEPTYQELRAAAYPSQFDYLDGIVKGDDAQVKKYIEDCLKVKVKYPK